MSYTDLLVSWKARTTAEQTWIESLIGAAQALGSSLQARLAPPALAFEIDGTHHRLIDIIKLPPEDATELVTLSKANAEVSADGVLAFGVSVAFKGVNSVGTAYYEQLYMEAAVKSLGGSTVYCVWDVENDAPSNGSVWLGTETDMIIAIENYFQEYLRIDPRTDPNKSVRMGSLTYIIPKS